MFTGIIEECGTLQKMTAGAKAGKIRVLAKKVLEGLQTGDSIAVNGICLTVTEFDQNGFVADVMPETVHRTAFSELTAGSPVNLERALTLSSRLGGHIVSGHIDGTGEILEIKEDENAIVYRIRAPYEILRGIVEKGSVAIDGISLTVVEVDKDWFSVSVIPHTRKETSLGAKKAGSRVNLENDVIGKYVERLLEMPKAKTATKPEITQEFLQKYGF